MFRLLESQIIETIVLASALPLPLVDFVLYSASVCSVGVEDGRNDRTEKECITKRRYSVFGVETIDFSCIDCGDDILCIRDLPVQ